MRVIATAELAVVGDSVRHVALLDGGFSLVDDGDDVDVELVVDGRLPYGTAEHAAVLARHLARRGVVDTFYEPASSLCRIYTLRLVGESASLVGEEHSGYVRLPEEMIRVRLPRPGSRPQVGSQNCDGNTTWYPVVEWDNG